jgi:hypothetical protein
MMCGHHPCDKPDCTHSERHRAACEARTVMRWPRGSRQDFYGLVKRLRGETAAKALAADVSAEYRKTTEGAR